MTIDILSEVQELMSSDFCNTEKQSLIIKNIYQEAEKQTQDVLDNVFIALCGYSLKTIIEGIDND